MDLDAALADLETDGFAIVRQAVAPEEVAVCAAGFDRLWEQGQQIARGALEQPRDARFVVDADPFRLHRVVWAGGAVDELEAMGNHPAFLAAAAAMLGSDSLVQIIQQAHFKEPGDDVSFGWHQDASNRRYGSDLWHDRDGRGTYAQICLAIDPMTAENGPLRMFRGSHSLGFIADPLTGAIHDLPDLPTVDVHLNPGDLALFGPFVVHGSTANTGTHTRRLFLQGYTLPDVNHRVYPGCGLGVARGGT